MTVLWWQNTSQNPNTPPDSKNTSKNMKTLPRIPKNISETRFWDVFWILYSVNWYCTFEAKLESLTQVNLIAMNRAKT